MAKQDTAPKWTRASLEKRIAELSARESALLAEQIDLEAAGAVPLAETHPQVRIAIDAEAMLNGEALAAPSRNQANRLFQVIGERKLIAKAIELANLRLHALLSANADEIARDIEAAWRKNIARTVALVAEIGKLASERENLRSEWRMRTGLPVTPGCYIEGAALVSKISPLNLFVETARKLRLV